MIFFGGLKDIILSGLDCIIFNLVLQQCLKIMQPYILP